MTTGQVMAWVSFLSVHEGPQRISKQHNGVALQSGMIVFQRARLLP